MAVDTRDRRMSMITLASPVPMVLPNTDGTIGTQDRAMLLWLYYGLSLAISTCIPICFTVYLHPKALDISLNKRSLDIELHNRELDIKVRNEQ